MMGRYCRHIFTHWIRSPCLHLSLNRSHYHLHCLLDSSTVSLDVPAYPATESTFTHHRLHPHTFSRLLPIIINLPPNSSPPSPLPPVAPSTHHPSSVHQSLTCTCLTSPHPLSSLHGLFSLSAPSTDAGSRPEILTIPSPPTPQDAT